MNNINNDLISRQALCEYALNQKDKSVSPNDIMRFPSAQSESCGDVVNRNGIVQKLNKMDRYVSTELRLCDTDKIFPQNEVFIVDDVYEEIVEQLPSVQPEIIRCSSCRYWTQSTGKMKGYGLGRCDFHDADLVTCNGFCYWAERRRDANND